MWIFTRKNWTRFRNALRKESPIEVFRNTVLVLFGFNKVSVFTRFIFDIKIYKEDFLHLKGWVIADRKITSVEIWQDGKKYQTIKYGLPRPDLYEVIKDLKVLEKVNCGFSFKGTHQLNHDLPLYLKIFCQDVMVDERKVLPIFQNVNVGYKNHLEQQALIQYPKAKNSKEGINFLIRKPELLDAEALKKTVESLAQQSNKNWEIYVPEDMDVPSFKEVFDKVTYLPHTVLKDWLQLRDRLKYQYIASLDAGDVLHKDYVNRAISILEKGEKIDVLYFDHDHFNSKDARVDPYYKPNFSRYTFESMDFVGRLCVFHCDQIKTDMWQEAHQTFAPCFNYVLSYLLAQNVESNISHHAGIMSTQVVHEENRRRHHHARKLFLESTLKNESSGALVIDGVAPWTLTIERKISGSPKISIVIPFKDKIELLQQCVESIVSHSAYKNYEILLVDNRSILPETERGLGQLLARHQETKVLRYNEPFNYSAINNYAVQQATGSFILFLNNDTEAITDNFMIKLLSLAQKKDVGAVGAKLLFKDRTIQHAGVVLGIMGLADHVNRYLEDDQPGYMSRAVITQEFMACTAACLMIEKKKFEEVGGFDEKLVVEFNDVDLCLHLYHKGFKNLYLPSVKLYHYESLSRGSNASTINQRRNKKEGAYIRTKWSQIFSTTDPFYNEYLSVKTTDFGLS